MAMVNTFTLIFKDKFVEYEISATDASLIVNVNSVVAMGMGVVVGPMLKILGFRKVSFIGGIFFTTGVVLTSWARRVTHFYITYSVMCGKVTCLVATWWSLRAFKKCVLCFLAIGMGLCSTSFPLAVNTYFKAKRTKAFGVGVTIAGLGPIIFPQVVSFLLDQYGASATCLIVAGLSLHIFVAAALLQPVKYHMKKVNEPKEVSLLEKGVMKAQIESISPVQPVKPSSAPPTPSMTTPSRYITVCSIKRNSYHVYLISTTGLISGHVYCYEMPATQAITRINEVPWQNVVRQSLQAWLILMKRYNHERILTSLRYQQRRLKLNQSQQSPNWLNYLIWIC